MKKTFKILYILSIILIIILAVLVFAGFTFSKFLSDNVPFFLLTFGVIAFLSIVLILINNHNLKSLRKLETRLSLWNTISYQVKGAGQDAFNNLPIGIIIHDANYNIVWSNKEASNYLMSDLQNLSLKEVANGCLKDFVEHNLHNQEIIVTRTIYDKIFELQYLPSCNTIYLTEITNLEILKQKYDDRTSAIGYINIDNYDLAINDLDVQEKSDINVLIVNTLNEFAVKYHGTLKALSESKFIICLNKKDLLQIMKDNFTILDEIKLALKSTKAYLITASIGFCCGDKDVDVLSSLASDALDLALNRGGDQVAVNIEGKLQFFGATTEPLSKDSKVNTRFKYQELTALIKNASKVFCMGHKHSDADSLASCLSMYYLCTKLGVPCYIALEEKEMDQTVSKVYKDIKKITPDTANNFISVKEAMRRSNDSSLLMLLDCQAEKNLYISPSDLYSFENIAVLDHHRKNEYGSINNPTFYYNDPSVSSTTELLFQLLQFADFELNISPKEATWILLGIVTDTSNFVYRTSAQTFQVASMLNKYQADMGQVQEYLKEELKERIYKNKLAENIIRYKQDFMISYDPDHVIVEPQTLSKVSDDLLSIEEIEFSATVGYVSKDAIRISARSLGRYNAQLIIERLGGGGHLNGAACELTGVTMDEAIAMLKSSIDEELNENNKTFKIILTSDYKNNGTRGDIIDVKVDEGRNAIREGFAVYATPANIHEFELEKERKRLEEEKRANFYKSKLAIVTKEIFDVHVLIKNGVISGKEVGTSLIKQLSRKTKLRIDRSMLDIKVSYEAYGNYKAKLTLDKNNSAVVKFKLIEK